MNFFEFKGIKIAGMATAVPDRHQKMSDYDYLFAEGEVEKFCAATGIYEKYNAYGVGTTTSDLCVAAANKLFEKLNINKDTIDGLIMITQTPDYFVPPTSCIVQHRLGLVTAAWFMIPISVVRPSPSACKWHVLILWLDVKEYCF